MRAILAAITTLLLAAPAMAAPTVETFNNAAGFTQSIIRFDGTTADSTAFPLGPACAVRVTVWGGAGSVELRMVPTEGTAASSGSLVGAAFVAVTDASVSFQPGQSLAKAVATTASNGTVMEVWCSNVQVSRGSGSVDGSAPASGVDSVLGLLENSDYDGDSTVIQIDADTDLLRSNVNFVSEMGIPTDTTYLATINDQTVGVVQGYVRWFTAMGDAPGTDDARLSNRNDILASWSAVTPSFGGRLQGKALGVFIRGLNTTTSHSCRISVHRNTAMAAGPFYPALDNTSTGPATDWAECTGAIEWGPASSNSGGVGDAGVIQRAGDRYILPLTDCLCTLDECALVVAVEDRDEGGGETCDDIDDVDVTLVAGEVPQ